MRRDLERVLSHFITASRDDFAILPYWFGHVLDKYEIPAHGFDRDFISNLAYCGWFVFGYGGLLPKFHRTRCVVDLDKWDAEQWLETLKLDSATRDLIKRDAAATEDHHIKLTPLLKRLRKVFAGSNRYEISLSSDFRLALERTNEFQQATQGVTWVEPGLAQVLAQMCRGSEDIADNQIQSLSWELWTQENELVACDIGLKVGAVYSSLTGFSDRRHPSIGIVQLVAEALQLKRLGFKIWDLGMEMDYKLDLGARRLSAPEYRALFGQHRNGSVGGRVPRMPLTNSFGFNALDRI